MPITALYAGLLTFLLFALALRVIRWRREKRVEIGDGNDLELLRRTRVHANFVEYVPMALVLMGLAESLRTSPLALHGFGCCLLIGRLLHAYALSQTPHILQLRVAGMMLTFTALIASAVACLLGAFAAKFGL